MWCNWFYCSIFFWQWSLWIGKQIFVSDVDVDCDFIRIYRTIQKWSRNTRAHTIQETRYIWLYIQNEFGQLHFIFSAAGFFLSLSLSLNHIELAMAFVSDLLTFLLMLFYILWIPCVIWFIHKQSINVKCKGKFSDFISQAICNSLEASVRMEIFPQCKNIKSPPKYARCRTMNEANT